MKITWPDGVLQIPSVGPARQIPQDLPDWNATLWVTEDGQPWRRQMNSATREVTWKPVAPTLRVDSDQFGITNPSFVPELSMIALAWRHRKQNRGPARAQLIDPSGDVHADNVQWKDEDDAPESGDFSGETWRDLEWGSGVQTAPRGYRISSRGRLYSPYSRQLTRGHYYKGHRYAGLNNGLLVNLTIASGLAPDTISLPAYLERAYNAFARGKSPSQHARQRGILDDTAMGYYIKIAPYVPDAHVIAQRYVHPPLWNAVASLPKVIRNGPLSEVRVHVVETLGRELDVRDMKELMLARVCLVGAT
jgi:hypothetical protein